MAIPSGLDAQLGIADETIYGTPVTVSRFYEFKNESLKQQIERVVSEGLRAGVRTHRSSRWAAGKKSVEGDIELELLTKGFGLWLKHMLGSIATTTPGGGVTTRDHTATPGPIPTGFTCQIGRPDVGGVVRAFTYHGCKVKSWELGCAVDEIPHLKLSILGEDEDTTTALAVPSYATGDAAFVFTQGTLTVAGLAQAVKEFTLTGDNGLADDRYFLGTQLRKEPLEAALRNYGGTLSCEFESLTAYNRFINGTEASLVLLFRAGVIEGALNYEFEVTANVRFDGETPEVGGPDVIPLSLPFVCIAPTTDASALTLRYRTSDATP